MSKPASSPRSRAPARARRQLPVSEAVIEEAAAYAQFHQLREGAAALARITAELERTGERRLLGRVGLMLAHLREAFEGREFYEPH